MDKKLRTSWLIGLGLIALFIGSWAITATITGNSVAFETPDVLESQLLEEDYRGTEAFVLGLVLAMVLVSVMLIISSVGHNQYTNSLLWVSVVIVLLAGIYSGTEPYIFELSVVEHDVIEKPAMPMRGQMLYGGIGVVAGIAFVVLLFDMRSKRQTLYDDEATQQFEPQDPSESLLN